MFLIPGTITITDKKVAFCAYRPIDICNMVLFVSLSNLNERETKPDEECARQAMTTQQGLD